MRQITFKPSYLEELVCVEVMIENIFRRKLLIFTTEEREQFFEAVYWDLVGRYLWRYFREDDERGGEAYQKMCAEIDKLYDVMKLDEDSRGLEKPREDLCARLEFAGKHAFELHKRISEDIMICEDPREWISQLKMLLVYIAKAGSEDTCNKCFFRFIKFINTANPDDDVLKAILGLEKGQLRVKVALSDGTYYE